ncbi:MAG: hypothetical protein ACOZCO_12580 [Bacteroidota bacterium]
MKKKVSYNDRLEAMQKKMAEKKIKAENDLRELLESNVYKYTRWICFFVFAAAGFLIIDSHLPAIETTEKITHISSYTVTDVNMNEVGQGYSYENDKYIVVKTDQSNELRFDGDIYIIHAMKNDMLVVARSPVLKQAMNIHPVKYPDNIIEVDNSVYGHTLVFYIIAIAFSLVLIFKKTWMHIGIVYLTLGFNLAAIGVTIYYLVI